MKTNTLLIASLILVSGKAAWAGCGPPKCPWTSNQLSSITEFATVVDCQKACSTCGAGQTCYCDPGSGFSCVDRPQNPSIFINDENGAPVLQQD